MTRSDLEKCVHRYRHLCLHLCSHFGSSSCVCSFAIGVKAASLASAMDPATREAYDNAKSTFASLLGEDFLAPTVTAATSFSSAAGSSCSNAAPPPPIMPLTGKASAPTIMQPTAKAYDEAPWRKRVDRPEQPVTPPRKPPQPQGPPLQQVRSPCLADWSLLPKEYGYWNWDDDTAMLEDEVATKYDMPWKLRGPPAPPNGGPELWLGLPFHAAKGVW